MELELWVYIVKVLIKIRLLIRLLQSYKSITIIVFIVVCVNNIMVFIN